MTKSKLRNTYVYSVSIVIIVASRFTSWNTYFCSGSCVELRKPYFYSGLVPKNRTPKKVVSVLVCKFGVPAFFWGFFQKLVFWVCHLLSAALFKVAFCEHWWKKWAFQQNQFWQKMQKRFSFFYKKYNTIKFGVSNYFGVFCVHQDNCPKNGKIGEIVSEVCAHHLVQNYSTVCWTVEMPIY